MESLIFLNFLTIFICTGIILFFRRMDRANTRIVKLKRFTDNSLKEFQKLVAAENRKFNDATIEMDLLLKKAGSLSTTVRGAVSELENRMSSLDTEKAGLRKIEEDLSSVSDAAVNVNEQLRYIEHARSDFGTVVKKINALNDGMKQLEKNNAALYHNFNEKLRDRSRELSEELAVEVRKLQGSVSEKEQIIITQAQERIEALSEEFSNSVSEMERSITQTGDAIMQNIRQKLERLTKAVNAIEGTVERSEKRVYSDLSSAIENAENEISQMFEKIENVEISIDQSRSKLIASFEEETNKIRNTMDSLSLHSIAKKDEIIKAARSEAAQMHVTVEKFHEQYAQYETNLNTIANDHMEAIVREYETIEGNFGRFTQRLEELDQKISERQKEQAEKNRLEFSELDERLSAIKAEIIQYEQNNRIFERTDEMMERVEDSIDHYTALLEKSRSESTVIESFMDDLEEFKEARRELEKELKVYNAKREKLQNVSTDIQALFDLAGDVKSKAEFLEDNSANIDKVNRRIDSLNETYEGLERQIRELSDYESQIQHSVSSIERVEALAVSIEKRLTNFQTVVEKSESRITKLREYLQSVEETTHILKTKEHEINNLKEKFNEIDSLGDYMESRVKQLQAMISKIENIRTDIDSTDERLQAMFEQTDRKMQQFSQFIQSVEPDNLITKQMNSDYMRSARGLNDGMVRTVRELSSKGWSAPEISRKLMLDENSVRLIINTATQ